MLLDSARHYSCGSDVCHQGRTNRCRCGKHHALRGVTVHTHHPLPLAVSKPSEHVGKDVEQYSYHNHGKYQARVYRAESSTSNHFTLGLIEEAGGLVSDACEPFGHRAVIAIAEDCADLGERGGTVA